MCYNDCSSFRFNPMDGTDKCTRGSRICPEEPIICENCDEEFNEWPDNGICPECHEHFGLEE